MSTDTTPASVGQRLLWFLDRQRGHSGALNCPMLCRIRGPVDLAALGKALDGLCARHESVRTTFTGAGPRLAQLVHQPGQLPVVRIDLATCPDPDAALRDALRIELRTRIDPTGRPLRATLWRVGGDDHLLCLNMHHLITDTWSCNVLFHDLSALYGMYVGAGGRPPAVGWQYAQFVNWQERQFGTPAFARHRVYWQGQLAGLEPARLPIDAELPGSAGERISEHAVIDDRVGSQLRQLAQTHGTTPFAVMLSVYYSLLNRVTEQDDLAVATLFANRARPELERTVGFCTNMVVLRTVVPKRGTFVDVVKASRTTVLEAFAHQELPYHILARTGAQPGSLRTDDVVFQMLAEAIDLEITVGDVVFTSVVPDVAGRFDFELALMPQGTGFAAKLYYTADRVDRAWARQFMRQFASAAIAAAATPYVPIERLRYDG